MKTADRAQELFDRLSNRGIDAADYWRIKDLVARSFPQACSRFYKEYGERPIDQVLGQIDGTKALLNKSIILSTEARIELEKSINIAEMLAWGAILEINASKVGPWIIQSVQIPIETDEDLRATYSYPSLRITATHEKSGEKRTAVIPGEELINFASRAQAWERAFEQLGIWDLVYRGSVHKGILSARGPRGSPIFTQWIVPRLYEYLLPHYEKPGHHSEKRDGLTAGKAQFPKELFEDMLLILRIEQPGFFENATVPQLMSVVQRYLKKKTRITRSSKNAETPPDSNFFPDNPN